ncbi:hypothetical protein, partial [Mycolicibacterium setense]|uniref:hypothetical protein n=1 Tax=Mycolicibacterium setense TaxID=431269 RepID=UPI0021F274A3
MAPTDTLMLVDGTPSRRLARVVVVDLNRRTGRLFLGRLHHARWVPPEHRPVKLRSFGWLRINVSQRHFNAPQESARSWSAILLVGHGFIGRLFRCGSLLGG